MKTELIITTSLLLVCLLGGSCASNRDFDNCLSSIVKPHRFSIVKWEARAIPDEVNQWIFGGQEKIDDEVYVVTKYFSLVKRIKILNSEIEAINRSNGQSSLTSLVTELDRLQEQKTASKETL